MYGRRRKQNPIPPEQIFDHPGREKTRTFISGIRSLRATIDSPDFDLFALHGRIEAFGEKHLLSRKATYNLMLLAEELLQLLRPYLRQRRTLELAVDYSEASGELRLLIDLEPGIASPLESTAENAELGLLLIRGLAEDIHHRMDDDRSRLELLVKQS